ncbi:MAG: hypothetical protein ABI423_00200 [Burkholderiales bacterium]
MATLDAIRTALALSAALIATPLLAADDAAQRKDLAAVIALNGQPCGEVLSYEESGKNDFVAACKDGNRYRVFVSAEGRVVVQKQGA